MEFNDHVVLLHELYLWILVNKEKFKQKFSFIINILERTNSITKLPSKPQTVSSPSFSKDFEYLIRREVDKLDNEHGQSTIQRPGK